MIGTSLKQYRITGTIGAGGMGEVFRARDARLNRDVAVKVLPRDFVAEADRLRRFEQESKTLANDTEYGLVAAQLKTGIVHINDQTINHEVFGPIGGMGASGNGARSAAPRSWTNTVSGNGSQ